MKMIHGLVSQGFKQVDAESVAPRNPEIIRDCTKAGGSFYRGMGCLGKWLQPEIFQDYRPREAYQEYLNEFQGAQVDVVNKGVFVYPEA